MRTNSVLIPLACAALVAACDVRGDEPAAGTAAPTAVVVDSIFPLEEMVRRFRVDAGPEPEGLRGGAGSRDAVVRRFVDAHAAHDTAAIRSLVMNAAEFAWLYYPHTPYYTEGRGKLEPQVVWFLTQQNSEKGITRSLRRFAGPGLRLAGHACPDSGVARGPNRVWDGCITTVDHPGRGRVSLRLFGSIIERDGHYKFVSYANDL